jgi:tRNA(fMet)-specific endonuclease VapC
VKYLLDTDTCIYALKGREEVLRRLLAHSPAEVALSVITEAELRTGAAKSTAAHKTLKRVEAFLAPLTVLDFTSPDAVAYATVRGRLERAGTPIGPLDTLIAAHALALDAVVVTNNTREFHKVPRLRVEDWSQG